MFVLKKYGRIWISENAQPSKTLPCPHQTESNLKCTVGLINTKMTGQFQIDTKMDVNPSASALAANQSLGATAQVIATRIT